MQDLAFVLLVSPLWFALPCWVPNVFAVEDDEELSLDLGKKKKKKKKEVVILDEVGGWRVRGSNAQGRHTTSMW